MRIGLQLLCGLVLIFALAAWFVLEIFVEEIKPGVRSATEDTLVDMAQMLAPGPGRHAGRKDGEWPAGQRLRPPQPESHQCPHRWPPQAAGGVPHLCDRRKGRVVYDSDGVDLGKDYSRWNDVYLTLRGEYGARSTRSDPDDPASSVMHVAARCGKGMTSSAPSPSPSPTAPCSP